MDNRIPPENLNHRKELPEYPPRRRMKLHISKYFYEGDLEQVSDLYAQEVRPMTHLRTTELKLRESRIRFIKQVPRDPFSTLCCPADYTVVIDIYSEALRKMNSANYERISSEAILKIRVVLGVDIAEPYDIAFLKDGMLLEPLEPQYAAPRIEWRTDRYRRHASWRLYQWRKEGWPDVYPRDAIAKEKKTDPKDMILTDKDWEE